MQNLLIYPHLFLFAYHLPETFADKTSIANNSWLSVRERLQLPPEADKNFGNIYTFTADKMTGFYQCDRLGDTDSLLVACSTTDEVTPEDLSCLQTFKTKLETGGNIGKTWLILGYLKSPQDSDYHQVAIAAYKAFTNTENKPNFQLNRFIGSYIFEYWHQPQDWTNLTTENDHLLICICPDRDRMDKFAEFYYDWQRSFYYRHKILWAYSNSRILKKSLDQEELFLPADAISEVKIYLPNFNLLDKDLQQLKIELHTNQVTLAKHTAGIEGLAAQQQTLEINLKNYQKRLELIERKPIAKTGITQLDSWQKFAQTIAPTYQEQIKQDCVSLTPGLRVREKYIDAIRGMVEICQEERDRKFQETVEIWGFGLGTSAIVATIISPAVTEITKPIVIKKTDQISPYWLPWLNLLLTILLTFIIGSGAKWLAEILVRSRRTPQK